MTYIGAHLKCILYFSSWSFVVSFCKLRLLDNFRGKNSTIWEDLASHFNSPSRNIDISLHFKTVCNHSKVFLTIWLNTTYCRNQMFSMFKKLVNSSAFLDIVYHSLALNTIFALNKFPVMKFENKCTTLFHNLMVSRISLKNSRIVAEILLNFFNNLIS